MPLGSLGFIETKSFISAIEATDAMLKSADINLLGREIIGENVTVIFSGEIGAVKIALEIGAEVAGKSGGFITSRFISRPHEELETFLLNNKK